MKTALTREKAIGLLREYNKEPFHVLHGLTVGGVLKWYARELGYGDERTSGRSAGSSTTSILSSIRRSTAWQLPGF